MTDLVAWGALLGFIDKPWNPDMTCPALTAHAAIRANQRGVPHQLIDALFEYADVDAPAGSQCRLLRISKSRLRDPEVRQAIGSQADRLAKLAVIWNDETGSVVTVLHHFREGHAGKRYRVVH